MVTVRDLVLGSEHIAFCVHHANTGDVLQNCTPKTYNFINQFHPNKFNKIYKKEPRLTVLENKTGFHLQSLLDSEIKKEFPNKNQYRERR